MLLYGIDGLDAALKKVFHSEINYLTSSNGKMFPVSTESAFPAKGLMLGLSALSREERLRRRTGAEALVSIPCTQDQQA